jgi:hypothetical protein
MEVVGPQIRLWLRGVLENGERDGRMSGGGGRKWEELFDERERVMLRFLEKVVYGPEIEDAAWEETRRWFSQRELVELVSLQVSFVCSVCWVGVGRSGREAWC